MDDHPDLAEALEAIDEVMGSDKGLSEDEWVEWCNRYLPLVQRHGKQRGVLEFG